MAIIDAPKCQYQQEDGTRCQRPARRRLRLCDYHHREHKRNAKRIAERARQRWFERVARTIQNPYRRLWRSSCTAFCTAKSTTNEPDSYCTNFKWPASGPHMATATARGSVRQPEMAESEAAGRRGM